MKFLIKTYGCQMNERDSDMCAALLQQRGYSLAQREAEADVVIVNTCSVRGKAEDKALGKLGLLVASKREGGCKAVGAVGCMVQRMGNDILRKVKGLDFAVGTFRMASIADVVDEVLDGGGPVLDVSEEHDRSQSVLCARSGRGHSAFVNILFGCDRRCSYCIVPDVRGPEWSRSAADIVEEAEQLAGNGVKEITLLGQSVLSYGRRNPVWSGAGPSNAGFTEPFPRLLEALGGVQGLQRIRFTSAHCSGCTDELAAAMARIGAVCPHVHLPVQSGSDRILKLMNRGYTAAQFKAAVGRLKAAVPGLAVTTDVIVGFPTESNEDFEATRAFLDEIMVADAFIFKYNSRPGTRAAAWADDVPEDEKLSRNHILLDDQDRRSLEINEAWIGHEAEVLVKGVSRRNRSRWSGRTGTNRIVVFDAAKAPVPGDVVRVAIDRVGPQTLYGKHQEE